MKHVMRLAQLTVAIAALGLLLPGRSLAYIDPGTGSYMLQMLIALAVGGAFALKLFWGRIMGFFRRGRAPSSRSGPTDSAVPTSAMQSGPANGTTTPAGPEQKKDDAD
jgi:hypothetical protein